MSAVAIPVVDGALSSLCLQVPDVASSSRASALYSLRPSGGHTALPTRTSVSSWERGSSVVRATAAESFLELVGRAWAFTSEESATVGRCYSRHGVGLAASKPEPGLLKYLVCLNNDWAINTESSTRDNLVLQADLKISFMKSYLSISRSKALDYMYEVIEDAYSDNDIGMLNEMLYSAAKHLADCSLAVSFLRATFRVRGRSEYWGYYYNIVKCNLEGRPDAERLLRGLGA